MADHDDWIRVAKAVRRRRVELGRTQQEIADDAGVSLATWRLIESAGRDRYQDLTVRGVTKALGWHADAIDTLLDGEAELAELAERPSTGAVAGAVPAGLASRWADLTPEEQSKVAGFIEGLLAGRAERW